MVLGAVPCVCSPGLGDERWAVPLASETQGLPEAAVTFPSYGGGLLRTLIGWASVTGAIRGGCVHFTSPVF